MSAASPPASTTGSSRSRRGASRLPRFRSSCRPRCRPNVPMSAASVRRLLHMPRRIRMMDGPRMMPTRRRGWRRRRAPVVHDNHRILNHRFLGRLDARAVAMGADGRSVGMGHNLHAVTDRAKRTVNVITIDPSPGRHAAGRQSHRRSRQNRHKVLVHNAPPFLVFTLQGGPPAEI